MTSSSGSHEVASFLSCRDHMEAAVVPDPAGGLDAIRLARVRGLLTSQSVGPRVRAGKCTFDLGPCRQRVGVCLTCAVPGQPSAGVCEACLLHCHRDHGFAFLIGTQPEFQCDCGSTLTDGPCSLGSGQGRSSQNHYDSDTFSLVVCCGCYLVYHRNWAGMSAVADPADLYPLYMCEDCVRRDPAVAHFSEQAAWLAPDRLVIGRVLQRGLALSMNWQQRLQQVDAAAVYSADRGVQRPARRRRTVSYAAR